MELKLDILSPEKRLFSGEVTMVEFPGEMGRFEVLINHAPLVSSLVAGNIVYRNSAGEETKLTITSGFVEIKKNVVSVCVEL